MHYQDPVASLKAQGTSKGPSIRMFYDKPFYTETPRQRRIEGSLTTRLLLIDCHLHRTKQRVFKPCQSVILHSEPRMSLVWL